MFVDALHVPVVGHDRLCLGHFMFRWWGMIAFAWACLLAPLVSMLWWALLRRWSLGRLLALTGATQVLCLLHALGPFLAVVPVLLGAAMRAGALRVRQVGQLGGCITALVVVNLTWAIPQLDFSGHVTTGGPSLRILQAGGLEDAWAILVLGRNPLEFGLHFPLFHSVLLVLALVGVVLPGSPGGGRARWPLGVGALALFLLTFSGPVFPAVYESQPLRYLPAAYAFLLPLVARTLAWGFARLPWRAATAPVSVMIVIALAYGPVLSPMAKRVFGPRLVPYLVGIPQEVSTVVDLLSRHTTPTARVLVEDSGGESSHQYGGSHATALLPHLLEREYFIGPAPYVPLQEDALVLIECRIGSRQVGRMPPADLRAYFDRYNIGWIVAWSPSCKARFSKLSFTRPVATEDRFTLYEVRRSHSFFLAGSGNVEATYDRLTLTGLTPGETVVLSYHYLDRLRTSSGHELVRYEDPADPIGFIEIRDVPESLVIRP
jgi:hypothetical protein